MGYIYFGTIFELFSDPETKKYIKPNEDDFYGDMMANKNLEEMVGERIYDDVQVHEDRIDLTVSEIFSIEGGGELDFGGSEYVPSELKKLETIKKHEDDDYGWWELEKGTYLMELNEKISGGRALLQPMDRLLKTGCFTPTKVVDGRENNNILCLIHVNQHGVNIKENSRIVSLYELD